MTVDYDLKIEAQSRIADTYTAAELCDLLEISVWDILEELWEQCLDNPELMKSIGFGEE